MHTEANGYIFARLMIDLSHTPVAAGDIMRPSVRISTHETLYTTLRKMIEEKRNSLTVINDDGTLAGMVTAFDILKAVLPEYLEESEVAARFANLELLKKDAERVKDTPITEFMEKDVPVMKVDGNIIEAAVIAAHSGRGRIVVVDEENKPLGILTRTELKQVVGMTLDLCGDCFAKFDEKDSNHNSS